MRRRGTPLAFTCHRLSVLLHVMRLSFPLFAYLYLYVLLNPLFFSVSPSLLAIKPPSSLVLMALPINRSLFFLLLIFFSLNVSSCLALRSDFYRLRLFRGVGREERKVGGRTEVKDVESNAEVQDLGRFSVEEYNRGRAGEPLTFSKVVEAQRQVVSGIKYYLRVAARDADGEGRTFDAVVVVRPWVEAKELVSFTPSTHS